jgi:hypothetical protein
MNLPGTEAPMNLPGTQAPIGTEFAGPTSGVKIGQTGHIATKPWNISGNKLGPIANDPSGSTLTPSALVRGD